MGDNGGFAVKRDGTIRAWGYNNLGVAGPPPNMAGDAACGRQTATGSICNPTPTRVEGLP
jgi:hypothetical protein